MVVVKVVLRLVVLDLFLLGDNPLLVRKPVRRKNSVTNISFVVVTLIRVNKTINEILTALVKKTYESFTEKRAIYRAEAREQGDRPERER